MGSMIFNFLKRAVIYPVVITGIIVAFVFWKGPSYIQSSADRYQTNETRSIDLADYSLTTYTEFTSLAKDGYVGSIQCETIALGEAAIVYDSDGNSDISLGTASTEPWNGGGLLLYGSNTQAQFKNLHNAKNGDVFEISFYSNDTYSYALSDIVYGVDDDEIDGYLAENTLIMALPYYDFGDDTDDVLYTLYIAEAQ